MDTGHRWVDRRIDILNSGGEKIPVSISTSVLRDELGGAVGGVETFRDLSALELLRKEIDQGYTFQDIISKNRRMRRILETLPELAAVDTTILIEGPTGSGKELVARAIHNLSRRAQAGVCRGQLRGLARHAARVRVVRLSQGRVHGCSEG